jgi:hypothetical protein
MLHIQTAVVNNPEWIELQLQTLKACVKGDWTFTVFNDAKEFADFSNFGDAGMRRRIQDTCSKLNIPCVPLQNAHHQQIQCPATRCYHALQNMLEFQRRTPEKGRYLCLDSDMFVMRPVTADIYSEYSIAIVPQQREWLRYFWNGLYMFDFSRIPEPLIPTMDWRCNDVAGVWTDVGGGMHEFLKGMKPAEVYEIPHLSSGSWGLEQFPFDSVNAEWLSFCMTDPRNSKDGKFFSELYDSAFFHFRAGGNWERRNPVEYQTSVQTLRAVIQNICKT